MTIAARVESQIGPQLGFAKFKEQRPSRPSAEEGRRLVVAFMGVKDAKVRDAIVNFVERLSLECSDDFVGVKS